MRDIDVPPELFGPWRPVGRHLPKDERAFPDDRPAACRCGWESDTQDWLTHADRVKSELDQLRDGRRQARRAAVTRMHAPLVPVGAAWRASA